MSARLDNLGLLATKKQHAQILTVKFKGLREQLHRGYNPYLGLAGSLPKAGDLALLGQEAARTADELLPLIQEIRALCDELGEPAPTFE